MTEIENTLCVRSVIYVTPVIIIERKAWVTASIIRRVNGGVYICTCLVRSDEYMCKTKHAFVYDSHFKPLHQSECFGGIIDNIVDAPICVLEDKDTDKNLNLKHVLKHF